MISFLVFITFVCVRYGHLNRIHYIRNLHCFRVRDYLSSTAPFLARDTDYYTLAAGANRFWHCATPSDR